MDKFIEFVIRNSPDGFFRSPQRVRHLEALANVQARSGWFNFLGANDAETCYKWWTTCHTPGGHLWWITPTGKKWWVALRDGDWRDIFTWFVRLPYHKLLPILAFYLSFEITVILIELMCNSMKKKIIDN